MVLPSGEIATNSISLSCPLSAARFRCVAMSHSLIVLSLPAEASVLPSGENAIDQILAGGYVPQPDRIVHTSRSERLAVGRDRNGADNMFVASDSPRLMPSHR